ncbi:sialate O-acetylesterase [Rubellimicrobium aerolatum]|uniref:Sialate O-acetylesterase n=1 Tax=Rubellimicrobium aerolatum TaxID=490979 RepID=A0ABW0SBN3_9RHOB|nr:sialate O-acetylesterase [Rubellimicrobium aerolatum]MBP1805899.1 hypothetical protein [Rubellimicrobium aerolatum]
MFNRRLRGWRGLALVLVALLAAFQAGAVTATMSPALRDAVLEGKRLIRVSLGLPKDWVPVPRLADYDPPAPVPCPPPGESVLIVTGGQSNAANSNSSLLPAREGSRVVTFYDGRCYPQADPVLGAAGQGGSLWVEFGARLEARLDRPIVFVHGAIGSTQFADWVDPRSGYLDALVATASGALAQGYRDPLVIWHQGETDAEIDPDGRDTVPAVRALLALLLDRIPDASIYLLQGSRCGPRFHPAATEAIRRAAAGLDRVTVGLDTDQMDEDLRRDGCHFNSLGRTWLVERLLVELDPLLAESPVLATGPDQFGPDQYGPDRSGPDRSH